ncbi:hypothetical protein OHA91_39600 (plasmid) [Streptomyces erythrochromogenes]|uniref:Uncharacterized protein n=1 Tax=Streptomyces erythrochromogenes TaxID=285574 RepID=A0ABZ1QQ42_9ACTN|nr:hypothetical protein [Streptomyces erythrochromogenes]
MATLGELFDVAIARLDEVARTPLASIGADERAALAGEVEGLLLQVQKSLGPRAYTPTPTTEERELTAAERNLSDCLDLARDSLSTARRYLSPQGGESQASSRIASATQALGAVRDTISSHLGPDRAALTPYAYLLRHQKAFDYLARRQAEVAWAAGRVVHRLTQDAEHPGAVDAFNQARASLDHASVYARSSTRDADHDLAAFPTALPVEPVHAASTDPTSAITARLAEDSERLSRAAYTALHDRADQRLSGSDLQQISRWNAMGRLLAGRTLLHVAEGVTDGAVRDSLKDAAAALRGSSKAWKGAAEAWTRVVDIGDPREHPVLPPPGLAQVKQGTVASMPSTDPHPAVVISRTSVVRLGQLLFGSQWTPEQPPGNARPAADVVADAGGEGALAAAAYRLSATGWQMAAAAPWVVRRAEAGLVTDSANYRPAGLDRDRRFYPAHPRQIEVLTGAYSAAMGAEQKGAAALLTAAQSAGTPVPRAMLDAAAHRSIAQEQKWVSARPVQAPSQVLPRAHVPTELVTGRRPGLRR